MTPKKILIICIVMLLCIGICITYHVLAEKKQAESKARQLNAFGVNWPYPISRLSDFTPEDFIVLLGQPNRTQAYWEYKPGIVYTTLFYDTFCVNMIHDSSSDKCHFAHVKITDSEQGIWISDIGIGSTKSEVEAAFHHLPKDPVEPNAYFDTVWGIKFYYSQNNLVTEIILYIPW